MKEKIIQAEIAAKDEKIKRQTTERYGLSGGVLVLLLIKKIFAAWAFNLLIISFKAVFKVSSKSAIPTGKINIEVETKYDTKERLGPATITLKVNGKEVSDRLLAQKIEDCLNDVQDRSNFTVAIVTDQTTEFKYIKRVMEAAGKIGVQAIIATQPTKN